LGQDGNKGEERMSPDAFIAEWQGVSLTERRVDPRALHCRLRDAAGEDLHQGGSPGSAALDPH
jgi:hypothetical protein